MLYLFITSVVLAVASFFDGKSTVDFLTKGKGAFYEADPIMVRIFGSATPAPKTVWVRGGLVIASEIGLALLLSHLLWKDTWILFSCQQLVQSGVHVWAYFHNENSLNAFLKSQQK